VGAAEYPGRWNLDGQEAIYTSTEVGVPVLERLVHTAKDLIPSNLAMMKIRVAGDWEDQGNALLDPRTGGWMWVYPKLVSAKRDFDIGSYLFAVGISPFALAVPSVIVPVWNVVLYPKGTGFWKHVTLESVECFDYDPRLFLEGTPSEAPEQEIAAAESGSAEPGTN
jgi:RES domain-containing protein